MRARKILWKWSAGFLIAISFAAACAPWITRYSFEEQSISEKLQGPSAKHWLGTDTLGRDLYSRIIYGARSSLSIGLVTALVALLMGVMAGAFLKYSVLRRSTV